MINLTCMIFSIVSLTNNEHRQKICSLLCNIFKSDKITTGGFYNLLHRLLYSTEYMLVVIINIINNPKIVYDLIRKDYNISDGFKKIFSISDLPEYYDKLNVDKLNVDKLNVDKLNVDKVDDLDENI